ncbi:hypothetical protein HPP92_012996 [Vanilla planifolia]|uniref:C2H2-type domain-containing protein n=1 Tax=Vanilla planifolia TaxID=51239 RepID=A0A835UUE4_VANPL|nr:hypothetical protein HPP92_012995 [Vanilla planifolia]KAG0476155.1 hypothetical protein HPP92_012996 [Vanilla planifolia]
MTNVDVADSSTCAYSDFTTTTGRSYDCIFCKRGFTTAQALGGHMNIHRKHRAKMTRPTPIFSLVAEGGILYPTSYSYSIPYAGLSFYTPEVPPRKPYSICFPASTSGARDLRAVTEDKLSQRRIRELRLFENEGWLRMYGGGAVGGEKRLRNGKEEEEGEATELDLELRLG